MNLVSLITFTAFIAYIYLAFFGLQLDSRSRLSRIFFCLCLCCALWAFCIAFMFPAADAERAWFWFRLSTPGWCLGPAVVLHFALALTNRDQPGGYKAPVYLIYLPGIIFTILGLTVGVTATYVVPMSFGFSPVNSGSLLRYWLYALYYLLCIALSIIVVWRWGKNSTSRRQQKQANIVVYSTLIGTLLASLNETILPGLGFDSVPKIPVVLWLVWACGMWTAISRYRLMIFTPSIASHAIIASIADMMLLLNIDGKILKTNRAIENDLGYSEDDLLGQPITRICPTWDSASLDRLLMGWADGFQEEMEWNTKANRPIPVKVSASAVKDSYDDLACLALVAQDLRPTKELEWEISQRRRAQQALKEYSNQLKDQNQKLEYQYAELEAMAASLAEANQTLEQKNAQLENLFDNVGQGFLSFSSDLLVDPESSRECLSIFGEKPTGQKLSALFYPHDQEAADFLDTLLGKILSETDPLRLDLFLSLLPEEITLYERCISVEYRVADNTGSNERIMLVILTDISEKRLLEARMQEEQENFSMVVKAIVYRDDLVECIEDFRHFHHQGFEELLNSASPIEEVMPEVLRSLHTFKGNFSQFDTASVVNELHQLESLLLETNKPGAYRSREDLLHIFRQAQLIPSLERDLKVIISFLGEEFFDRAESYNISKQKLLELEQAMRAYLPAPKFHLLLPLLRTLRYRPFKELVKSYPEYVQNMAMRMGKQVYPFLIEGDDLMVDNEYYHPFARALVHVFRNCVDYGLENPETRVEQGKDDTGRIHCRIGEKDGRILVSIKDDGPGIDWELLRRRAVEKGLFTPEEAALKSEADLVELIFYPQFSTQTEASLISGRGVGLSAVKTELDKIGGQVRVYSAAGTGTEFLFELPLADSTDIFPPLSLDQVTQAVAASACHFVSEQTGINFYPLPPLQYKSEKVFDRLTALIFVQGISSSLIALSYSDELLDALLQAFVLDEVAPDELELMYKDLLAETSNIIVGNALKQLGPSENILEISTPMIECSKSSLLKHFSSPILCHELREGNYALSLCLVSMDDGLIEEKLSYP